MKAFPRILGVYMDDSASSYYRVHLPMKLLYEHGFPVGWGHIDNLADAALDHYDMVLISRTGAGDPERVRAAIESIKAQGKVVALDYDDDVLNVPLHNPGRLASIDGAVAAMETANGLVVTNTALAASLRPFNRNIAVVPNYIDPRNWPQRPLQIRTKPVVGLVGSASHVEDWKLAAEPMRRIMARHDVDFLVAGFVPDYLRDLVTMPYAWMPLTHYPYVVNQIDIGLCPLVDDHFNRCKSPIKAFEYGLAGAAVIASPTQYDSVVRGKGTIARTALEWELGIEKYIVDANKRRLAARGLNEYVEKRWNIGRYVAPIAQTYHQLYRHIIGPARPSMAA